MPRGIPNKQPSPPMKADNPTAIPPLILLQPAIDGTRIDAYGLDPDECIDELRRALLHLVARQAGVTIISEVVSRQAAVVLAQRATWTVTATPASSPSANGSKPKTKKSPRSQYGVQHAPELRHLPDDDGDVVTGRQWTEMEDIDFQRGV